ncbi:MAG TPA: DUF192 domain-containing protein [Patescibacteria group bacterium]|nr:DUF192 domain-containing protein [Patescibacteria group bacterium]
MSLTIHTVPWYLSWKGLLFSKKPKPILFQTRWGIHTFGMKYPIDVVIVDKKNIVQKIKQGLRPNRFFFWNPCFDKVLELPSGTIEHLKITLEGKLELQTL